MKYELINIGRNKVSRVVEITDLDSLIPEVKKHLMSNDVTISFGIDDDTIPFFGRIYAGIREVGQVRRVDIKL